jgi:glycerophosphoryl diester phosphodiesterase
VERLGSRRRIPRPSGESEGLRDDASRTGEISIEPRRPLLLGHRGARAVRTISENSPASFDRALADGCDGFEFDVRITADREAIICHDPTSGGIEIAEAAARQLPQLARLADVLSRYQNKAFLDIELKVAGLEKITTDLVRKFIPRRGFVVSSFRPEVIKAVHAEGPDTPLGLICETKAELSRWRHLPIEYVIPHHQLLDADLIRELKAAGKKIFVWTVNDAAEMKRFQEREVDGIISDDTSLLCRSLLAY